VSPLTCRKLEDAMRAPLPLPLAPAAATPVTSATPAGGTT
jgi:hypothetical protein